jgi:hypothetical protein
MVTDYMPRKRVMSMHERTLNTQNLHHNKRPPLSMLRKMSRSSPPICVTMMHNAMPATNVMTKALDVSPLMDVTSTATVTQTVHGLNFATQTLIFAKKRQQLVTTLPSVESLRFAIYRCINVWTQHPLQQSLDAVLELPKQHPLDANLDLQKHNVLECHLVTGYQEKMRIAIGKIHHHRQNLDVV